MKLLTVPEYSKHGETCILSGLDGDTVVLPPSAIPWLIDLPDSTISTDESTKNVLQTKYSFSEPQIMDRAIHFGQSIPVNPRAVEARADAAG